MQQTQVHLNVHLRKYTQKTRPRSHPDPYGPLQAPNNRLTPLRKSFMEIRRTNGMLVRIILRVCK